MPAIDKCMRMEDRRKRYEIVDKVKELRRDLREKMGKIEIDVEYKRKNHCIKIGKWRYRWRRDRWEKCI